jgi:hypothetical protein
MLDCLSYLAQMDSQAGCYTTILLLPGGSSLAPGCIINLLSVEKDGGAFSGVSIATSYDGYPSREHATFGGALYRAIVEHDKVLSARQLQVVLDITG